MSQVNFVREAKAFHSYANSNAVTSNERHLWWALFFMFNENAHGTDWPDGFLSFSNKQTLAHLPYSEDSLDIARKKLAKRGLIEYKPGRKNTLCPRYKLNYLTIQDDTRQADEANVPFFAGNTGGNMPGNLYLYARGNTSGRPTDIPINLYETLNDIQNDSGYDSAWRSSGRARGAVAQRIINNWGGDKSGGFDIHGDIVYYLEQGMTPATIEKVLGGCESARYVSNHLEAEAIWEGIIDDPSEILESIHESR